MYADGALGDGAARALEEHLARCEACAAAVAALRVEREALRAALLAEDAALPIPVFAPHARAGTLFMAVVGAALAAAAIGGWRLLAGAVPDATTWLLGPGTAWALAADGLLLLIREGRPMLISTMNFVGAAVLVTLIGATAALLLRRRAGAALTLSLAALAASAPSPSHAVEIRRGTPLVSVAPGETIDDTLMAFAETISIDGTVNGDLVAFGERVNVRGSVTGDVITGAQSVTIEGSVGGNVIGFGRSVAAVQARVARNLYAFGNDVAVGNGAEVAGNATMFGNEVAVRGRVGRDVLTFSRSLAVSGEVQRNVEAFSGDIMLLPSARVGGNVTAHVSNEDDLQTAPGADVGGATATRLEEGEAAPANRYFTASFYVRQAVRLGAAFVTGLLLFWLFPSLLRLEVRNGGAALRAGGLGLVAAVGLPIAAIVAFVTIIGIPLGIAAAAIWLFGLYFAKIVVAQIVGAALFRSGGELPHHAATLLAGLVVVIIAVNLPLVGGLVNLVLTLVGLGLLLGRRFGDFDRPLAAPVPA
jgi:cytoskeletal protein CcmA (bactofilin family)